VSNLIYPTLPGLDFGVSRSVLVPPVAIKTTPSLREFRARNSSYVRYEYSLAYEFLRTRGSWTELQSIVGFFNLVGGPYDSFLFNDPDDNTATAEQFATGNGTTTVFQLVRAYGGFAEAVYDFNGAVAIFDNGSNVGAGASVSSTGVVTFTTAPAAGHLLTWSGQFYHRCRFKDTELSADKFMDKLWAMRKVNFMTVQA
jgi:uncharacterized protein (TIGR02217 family)